MAKLPWFQFYPADWIQDTQILSLQGRGAWITLLCQMWVAPQRGTLVLSAKEFNLLMNIQTDEEAQDLIHELTGVADVTQHEYEHDSIIGIGYYEFTSRRMVRDGKALQARKDKDKRYNDKRTITKRGDTTRRSQKSEVISDNLLKKEDLKTDLVDKSKEHWQRDLHAMWGQVKQMAKRQPQRFDKTLGAWVGAMMLKRWQPTEIKAALMDFVRFEDSNTQIVEWYPYLNAILQKTRTKAVQGESAQYKDYDPESMANILKDMGLPNK